MTIRAYVLGRFYLLASSTNRWQLEHLSPRHNSNSVRPGSMQQARKQNGSRSGANSKYRAR